MEIREALRKFLAADAGVSALVGGRIWPDGMPQDESDYPQITFFKVSGPRVRNLRGPDGLAHPRIQIDSWGLTRQSAVAVAEAVRLSTGGGAVTRLDGFRGPMGGTDGVKVQSVNFEDERDTFNAPVDDSDIGVFQVSQDLIVWWDEG